MSRAPIVIRLSLRGGHGYPPPDSNFTAAQIQMLEQHVFNMNTMLTRLRDQNTLADEPLANEETMSSGDSESVASERLIGDDDSGLEIFDPNRGSFEKIMEYEEIQASMLNQAKALLRVHGRVPNQVTRLVTLE